MERASADWKTNKQSRGARSTSAKKLAARTAFAPTPGQGFFTKQPVKSLDDLKGQKLRIYSRQTQIMGQKLGMESLILPFAEVPIRLVVRSRRTLLRRVLP